MGRNQKVIYVVYECNGHRDYDSFVIKWMTRNLSKAKAFYEFYKQEYVEDNSWFFNLGSYEVDYEEANDESDFRREFEMILTTENNA